MEDVGMIILGFFGIVIFLFMAMAGKQREIELTDKQNGDINQAVEKILKQNITESAVITDTGKFDCEAFSLILWYRENGVKKSLWLTVEQEESGFYASGKIRNLDLNKTQAFWKNKELDTDIIYKIHDRYLTERGITRC
jgi:hypothetical protein